MSFFESLNFSSTNEDGVSEVAALAGAQRILCITGSGTRPLDLLAGTPADVVALDANPVQNHLLALKVAAIEKMDRHQYLAFLGIAPGTDRLAVYRSLRDALQPQARDYWDKRQRRIARGIWYAGRWERLLSANAMFLRLLRGRAITALMAAPDLDQQARIWSEHFTSKGMLGTAEAAIRSLVWRVLMREPASDHLPVPRAVAAYLDERFADASTRFLFRDSDCATLALTGGHQPDGALPLHLKAGQYETVRAGLRLLAIRTAGLAEIPADAGTFDGFSLSDFGSYCAPSDYVACWRGILSVAAPGARFCERLFLNEDPPPNSRVAVDEELSARLSASDTAVIYRIRAGRIRG